MRWLAPKLVLTTVFVLASCPFAGRAVAQDAAAPLPQPAASPILTVTQERLYSGTLFGKVLQARTEAATLALQAENRKIEADLEAEEKVLTARRATMAAAEFRTLADAFDLKVEGIRTAQEAKARALSKEHDAGRKQFFETAIPILAQLMGDMGAVAILDKSAIVLSFDRIDVTDQAIARIDAVLGDGSRLPTPQTPPEPVPDPTTPPTP